MFEMRIYPADYSVNTLKQECKIARRESSLPIDDSHRPDEIDLTLLNEKLKDLPVARIRKRRVEMNLFFEEVLNSADPDRGIAFTSLLMILAHYKVINDSKSLRLEEFLRRRARLQRVNDDVRRAIVSNFLDTVFWSRRFKEHMATKRSGRLETVPQLQVPEIFVEDEELPSTPLTPGPLSREQARNRPSLSLQIPGASTTKPGSDQTKGSSTTKGLSTTTTPVPDSIQVTPAAYRGGSDSPLWIRRPSDFQLSPYAMDRSEQPAGTAARVRSGTAGSGTREIHRSNTNARDVLDVLDNSEWGQSIRRSLSVRRSNSLNRGSGERPNPGNDPGSAV